MEWINAKDNPPGCGERVILCTDMGFVGEGYLSGSGKYRRIGHNMEHIEGVTHWMPLPEIVRKDECAMGRMTYTDKTGKACLCKVSEGHGVGEAINKLGEYEDTGLEPSEIAAMQAKLEKYQTMLNINDLATEVHENAVEHGWWSEEPSFPEIIALCHAELSEALEEYRDDKPAIYYSGHGGVSSWKNYVCQKPEGVAVELVDCILRILDYVGRMGWDIEEIIREKHEYNKTRQYRHGGKVI